MNLARQEKMSVIWLEGERVMSKVLVFNFPGEGHINPTIALVEELIQRGEEVIYYCVEEYRKKIEKTKATFRAYENFMSRVDIMKRMNEKTNPLEMALRITKATDEIVADILEEIREEEYDYVIYDNNFPAGWIIADILNLPKISSCTTFAMNELVYAGVMNMKNQIDKESPMYQEIMAMYKKWKDQYGIDCNGILDMINHPGDMTIVFTSKLYQPHAEQFDDSFIFVGPSIAQRKDVEHFPFEKIQTDKLIFISMGTVFNQRPEFYHMCFEAFRDSQATVVLSVGKNTDINQFHEIPSNFMVFNYVPQLEVLQQADVFITHGGMNSSSEGLYFGVPLVVIPVAGDQPIVAKRVEELGAGIQLDRRQLTADQLRAAAERVLHNPSFAENSRKIGDSLKEAGGFKKAADEIFKFRRQLSITSK